MPGLRIPQYGLQTPLVQSKSWDVTTTRSPNLCWCNQMKVCLTAAESHSTLAESNGQVWETHVKQVSVAWELDSQLKRPFSLSDPYVHSTCWAGNEERCSLFVFPHQNIFSLHSLSVMRWLQTVKQKMCHASIFSGGCEWPGVWGMPRFNFKMKSFHQNRRTSCKVKVVGTKKYVLVAYYLGLQIPIETLRFFTT